MGKQMGLIRSVMELKRENYLKYEKMSFFWQRKKLGFQFTIEINITAKMQNGDIIDH